MNYKSKLILATKSGTQQCQKCLKYGHFTFECRNKHAYLYRPSRSQQLKKGELTVDLTLEKPPKLTRHIEAQFEKSSERSDSSEESESCSSSSLSSEDKMEVLVKVKKIVEEKIKVKEREKRRRSRESR